MKAVILAAGRGTRIDAVTHGLPKCLLEFDGRAILDHQIEALWAAGVSQIGIVIGHRGERIVEHVESAYPHAIDSFHFIRNPLFATTNNIYSLWLARGWVACDDVLCLNADVLCHPAILARVAASRHLASMIVDPEWRDETMKVIIRDGSVIRMSKSITADQYSGTYIGITAFSRKVVPLLYREIGTVIAEGGVHEFFNVAVQRLVDKGLRVDVTPTGRLP
jgi:choline kinase